MADREFESETELTEKISRVAKKPLSKARLQTLQKARKTQQQKAKIRKAMNIVDDNEMLDLIKYITEKKIKSVNVPQKATARPIKKEVVYRSNKRMDDEEEYENISENDEGENDECENDECENDECENIPKQQPCSVVPENFQRDVEIAKMPPRRITQKVASRVKPKPPTTRDILKSLQFNKPQKDSINIFRD
jgi:hypothetical protein